MVDVCVGTSVGTITEPDCLGPCEPGTSVTLEGIVWHETEGGKLLFYYYSPLENLVDYKKYNYKQKDLFLKYSLLDFLNMKSGRSSRK